MQSVEESKHPGGRPPMFETPEDLQKKIDEYFEYIKGEKKINESQYEDEIWIRNSEYPSITGLCLFLGFESRQSFHDYQKKDKFTYALKKARMMIEASYEQALHSKNPTGAIFALKNFGWTDKHEVEHSGTVFQLVDPNEPKHLNEEE